MHEISDIATDPSLIWNKAANKRPKKIVNDLLTRYEIEGVRDGVRIRTILEPGGEGIISGYPLW